MPIRPLVIPIIDSIVIVYEISGCRAKIHIFCEFAIRKPRWSVSNGAGWLRFQSRGLGLTASSCSCGPLALRQHGAGLLAGAGVDEVVAEEDLRGRSAGGAVLGHVVRGDVDGGVVR